MLGILVLRSWKAEAEAVPLAEAVAILAIPRGQVRCHNYCSPFPHSHVTGLYSLFDTSDVRFTGSASWPRHLASTRSILHEGLLC